MAVLEINFRHARGIISLPPPPPHEHAIIIKHFSQTLQVLSLSHLGFLQKKEKCHIKNKTTHFAKITTISTEIQTVL